MNLPLKLRKNIFVGSIVILTIVLLIFFKIRQTDKSNNKNVINQLFSENVRPIFTSENFNKKEIVSFALKGDLVLDKTKKKVLQLRSDSFGKKIIGIRNEDSIVVDNNYQNVIENFNLNYKQKNELDSILESYSKILSQLIYKDDNNLFAVNPNIGLVKASLNNALSNFISQKGNKKNTNFNKFDSLVKSKEKNGSNDYLIFSPDTVFYRQYEKVGKLNKYITESKKTIKPNKLNTLNFKTGNFKKKNSNIHIDSNFVNITIDNFLDENNFEDLKFYKKTIDSSKDKVKLSFQLADDSLDNIFVKFTYTDSTNNNIQYEINSDDFSNTVSNSIKIFSGKNLNEWIEYGIKMDSISRKIEQTKASNEIKKDGF